MNTQITLNPNEKKFYISGGIFELKIESSTNSKFEVKTGSVAFNFNGTYTENRGIELIDFSIENLTKDIATFEITTDNEIVYINSQFPYLEDFFRSLNRNRITLKLKRRLKNLQFKNIFL